MKETELKPCSCGCEAELVESQAFSWCDVTYYVRCTNPGCDERTKLKYEHKIDAINAWNKKQEFLLPLMLTDKEKQIEETVVQKTTYGEAHLAIGDGIPRPLTTVINCKKIIIAQKSIGVEIDVSENFERTDTIIVNGVEYHKQSEVEILEAVDMFRNLIMNKFIELCNYNDYGKINLLLIGETIDRIYDDVVAKMKGGAEE